MGSERDWRFLYRAIVVVSIVAMGFACGVGVTLKMIVDAYTGNR